MGLTKTILEIANPKDSSKRRKGEFLVDSGAFYTVLPKRMVLTLGLIPSYKQEFTLADGSTVEREISSAEITFENRTLATPVVLGEKNDTALMGVLTLEAFGLILDPFERKLHPAKMML